MEKKTKRMMVGMNKNMFNYLTKLNVECELKLINKHEFESLKGGEEPIPIYQLTGKNQTNKKFKFTVDINPVTEKDFNVVINLDNKVSFKLENNSQLKFAVENYIVPETVTEEKSK